MSEFTICKKCIHFEDGDIWYNQFCLASPLPLVMDPVDGQVKPQNTNDLGAPYFTENRYQYAKNINKTGNCPKYSQKLGGLIS
jgi:hypothetical protein